MDEKTGIQALGRTEERAPDSKGRCKRKEFEYVRNGTTGLMAAIDVGKGRIVQQMLHPSHTEKYFDPFFQKTVEFFPSEDEGSLSQTTSTLTCLKV